MKKFELFNADCFEKLKDLSDESIDLVLTDFPYGISFMGKDWDSVKEDFYFKVGKALMPKMKAGSFLVTTFTPRQDMLWKLLRDLEKAGFELKHSGMFWLYHCVSKDTEILTNNGWRTIDTIKKTDKCYSFNINEEKIEVVPIKEIIKKPYKGKMLNLKNFDTDQLLTPNHKILKKHNKHSGNKHWVENKWNLINASDFKVKSGIYLPLSFSIKEGKSIGLNYAKLLGWILTDGQFDKSNRSKAIRISQSSVKQKYVEEIQEIINSLGIKYKKYERKRKYKNKIYIEHTWFISGLFARKVRDIIPNKKPNLSLLNISYEERLAIYDSIIKGDGSRRNNVDVFYQNDSKTRDWFKLLCWSLGFKTSENVKKYSVGVSKFGTTQFQRVHELNNSISLVDYNDLVWCLSNKNKTVVCKRNGKIFITGNTGFPKASDVSKNIDKQKGLKGNIVGNKLTGRARIREDKRNANFGFESGQMRVNVVEPESDEAKQWSGFKSFQLKPAVECVVVAQKPKSEKTIVGQVLKNGCGVVNVEACRIPYASENDRNKSVSLGNSFEGKSFDTGCYNFNVDNSFKRNKFEPASAGRFPANLICGSGIDIDFNELLKLKEELKCGRIPIV